MPSCKFQVQTAQESAAAGHLQRPDFAQVVFDATEQSIWTTGVDGRITSINQAAVKMFGYSNADEMVGRNAHELVHHTRSDGTRYPHESCAIYRALQKGQAIQLDDEVLWRADGTSFHADYESVPFCAGNKIVGAVVTLKDSRETYQTRNTAQDNRLWLESTLNSIADAVVTTDVSSDSRITFFNPVAEALTGWSAKEALGQPLAHVCRLVDSAGRAQPCRTVTKTAATDAQNNATAQAILQSRDGRQYFVEQRVTRIRDRNGVLQGLVSVYHDSTDAILDKRRMQENQAHLNLALEGAQMGTWSVDLATSSVTCSPQVDSIVGEPIGDMTIQTFLKQFVHQDDLQGIKTRWLAAIRSGSQYVDEYRILRRDASIRWVSLNGRPARRIYDDKTCISGVITDITQAVDLRLQAQQGAEKLATERENLARVVENLNVERDLRERFVVALTHDLRAPMTAAKMSAQLLKRRSKTDVSAAKLTDRIVESVDRAERMVQDLLDANRLKAGHGIPIDPGVCQIDAVVDKVASELVHVHGNRFQVVKAAANIVGFWDENSLHRILENLASNAVKYGAIDTPITIAVNKGHNAAQLSVHNEGPLMPAEDCAVLFDPFRRLDSAVRSGQRGWGIGLSLVKGLTEAHGGTVSVESAAGKGTTFTVRLPITQQVQS